LELQFAFLEVGDTERPDACEGCGETPNYALEGHHRSYDPDKFDQFLPKAQKVLDTVEWKGGKHLPVEGMGRTNVLPNCS
jgi:hypothetical protein